MSQQQAVLTDFTKGELSPRMMGRFDLQDFFRGAREIRDFLPFFPGGITYRPGFNNTGDFKGTGIVRIHPLIITSTVSYLLEIGPLYLRFWRSDAIVGGGTPLEITTPWAASDLWNLQFAQNEAKLYVASGTAMVKVLEMTSLDAFTFADLTITGTAGNVPFQGAGNYPRCIAFHDGILWLASTINKPAGLWASKPYLHGTFVYYETIVSTTRQYREPYNEFVGDTASGSTTVSGISAAEIAGFKVGDRITGPGIINKNSVTFVGETTVGSNVITGVSSSVTAQLAIGETIGGQSIPASTITNVGANSVTIDNNATATEATNTMSREERRTEIVTIGASSIVVSIAATATANDVTLVDGWNDPDKTEYETVTTTRDVITSASAMEKELASDQNEQILWLCSGRDLVVGTTTGERVVPSGSNAVTFSCKRQTAIGSRPIQPFMLNEAIIFIEGNGRAAREYLYSQNEQAYQSPSLTALADHILAGEVTEMDYQNTPLPIAWFTLKDGTVAGCVYSRLYQLAAWFRVEHAAGLIESMAIIPGSASDQVYAAVNRGGVRRLERMGAIFGTEGHLDSSGLKTKTSGSITGVTWLTGAARVCAGSVFADVTIAAGAAVLPTTIPDGTVVRVGLSYTGRVKTMPINSQARIGNGQMRLKAINNVKTRLLECYPFKVGYDGGTMERAAFTGPLTGDYGVPVMGSWDTEACLLIEQDEPFDTTILAIAPEVDAGG